MTISNEKIDELKEEVQIFLEGNPSTSEVKIKRRKIRSKLRELYSEAISIPLKEATKKIEDIKSQYKDNPEERDSKIKEIEEQFYREVPKSRRKEKNLSWFFANAGSSERTAAESETQYETLTELPPEESKKLIKEIFGTEKGDLLLDILKDIEVQYKGGSLTGREFAKHPNPSRYRNSTFKNLDTISVEDITKLRESKNPAFKIIVNKLQEMKEKETTTYEGININADSLIAGFSLSKASERKKIYKFWQDVVKKEEDFFKALDSFKNDLAAIKIDKSEQGAFMEKLERFDKLYEDDSKLNDLKYLKAFSPEMKEVPNPLGLLLNILAFESAKHDAEEEAFEDDSPQELADFISDYSAYIPDTESGGGGGTKASFDIYKPEYIESIESDEQDEIIELEKTMENIDPLLLYDMEVNKTYVLIQKTISQYKEDKKEWEETDAAEFMRAFVNEYRGDDDLDPEDRDDYLEIIDSLQDTFALTQGEKAIQSESYGKEILEGEGFILPIFVAYEPAFRRALEDTKNKEVEPSEVDEAIFELIKFLTEFMNVSFQFAQTQGKKARKIEGYQKDTPMASFGQRDKVKVGDLEQSVLQTMKGKRFKNEMAQDLKDAFTPLLTAMSDYYFKPFFKNRDVGGKPKYLSSKEGRKLVLLANDLGVDDLLGSSYQKILRSTVGKRSSLQKKIKVKDFQNIYNFLIQTRNPKNFDALINDGENASKSLTKIFGSKYSERNNNTIAKIIAALNKKVRKLPEDNPHKRNTEEYKEYEEKAGMVSKFNGKAISTRERQYNKDIESGLEIPLFALPYWLTMNKRSFTKDTYKNIFTDLESYYDSSENIPQVLTKMLLVHDEIRKMLGKDVVQGFYALQYRDIDDFITKMHQEKDLDLSHMEVTEIVKSYDSHENISKEYGISSDEVYLVKANFR
tara:strand:- start:1169 stop:3922 length:2754 start_codon:yes stop_codon:yes gene_type:complete